MPSSKSRIGVTPAQDQGKKERIWTREQPVDLVATAFLIVSSLTCASVSPGQVPYVQCNVTPDIMLRYPSMNLFFNQGCSWKLPHKLSDKRLPKRYMGLVLTLVLMIAPHLSASA